MRILIVDDSKAMRMIVKRALRQAGYGSHTFEEAGNGKEALDAVRASPPDLVLTDWNMPEMSGIELLEQMGNEPVRIPAGVVTSQGTPEARARAREAGARFVLTKPVSSESLQEALDQIFG